MAKAPSWRICYPPKSPLTKFLKKTFFKSCWNDLSLPLLFPIYKTFTVASSIKINLKWNFCFCQHLCIVKQDRIYFTPKPQSNFLIKNSFNPIFKKSSKNHFNTFFVKKILVLKFINIKFFFLKPLEDIFDKNLLFCQNRYISIF